MSARHLTLVTGSLAGLLVLGACGGRQSAESTQPTNTRSRSLEGESAERVEGENFCDASASDLEASEYDTSGDEHPDVRRVYKRLGAGSLTTSVLVCREVDLNGDGVKDIVRRYNEEGRPVREDADRDFDGQMDQITFFQEGVIVRVEEDANRDGRVDTKVFYEDGKPNRVERDLSGRSTTAQWQPDRWEYYDDGQMVRMGTDIDGDGLVDRWDRDDEWSRRQAAEQRQRALEQAAENAQEDLPPDE